MEPKESRGLDGLLDQIKPVREAMGQKDYLAALFLLDNMQGDYKKDALYAAAALGMAKEMDEKGVKDGYALQLGQALLQYCQSQCSYFSGTGAEGGNYGTR